MAARLRARRRLLRARSAAGLDLHRAEGPHPDRILVYRFAVKPEEVKLDQGVSARLQQQVSDTPLSAQDCRSPNRLRSV